MLQSIATHFSEYGITATAGISDNMEALFGIKTTRCRMNEGVSLGVLLSMIKDCCGMTYHLLRSDALMYGGGGLIHDLTPYNLVFMYFWHLIALMSRKKIFYYAIGIGPIDSLFGNTISRFFLSRSNFVFARDNRGKRFCDSMNIDAILTSDGAFSIRSKNLCNQITLDEMNLFEQDYVCVTLSAWFESSNFWKRNGISMEGRISTMIECIKALQRTTGKRVVFVPTVIQDIEIAIVISKHFSKEEFIIVPKRYNCIQMAEIIENSYLLFGIRMHSIIFAARQSVPFIAAVYDQKVWELLETLEMKEYGVQLSDITPDKIETLAARVALTYESIQQHLQKKAIQLYNINIENIQKIKNTIDKGW